MQNIDELIMISALQHYSFCPRQCALIYLEQVWEDNRLTVEGSLLHERVHEEGNEMRAGVRIERGVSLRSLRLGLIGKADVVEFHRQESGAWLPSPVEYKRGKPKPDFCDKIQLCAQALCLEEMLHTDIHMGAIFYGQTRRRLDVIFDAVLRRETEDVAQQVRELLNSEKTPKPLYAKRCENCSLMADCLPTAIQKRRSVKNYLQRMTGEV